MPGWEALSREQLLDVVVAQAGQAEELTAQAEELTAQVEAQAARIEALVAQVAELSRRLGQNSGISSLPLFSGRFTKAARGRRAPSTRKPGKPGKPRKPGKPGKPGKQAGASLEMVADRGRRAACYGANLRALAVYLVVFQHVPVERAALAIADLTGARVCTGWVSAQVARAGEHLGEVSELVRTLIVGPR